ncbi:diaminopimelate decarboxylase [Paenibacillus sp. SYP-B4298]|uniref:diaminopimelate decarboxylase n=1 Tax=Paenibacillus sp. SYP-B4298 TaxID=2996034 RepID=UPI0022DDDB86|nr:diaminopimelate decarboxylase [Paenibacillus sp. SYP-B4298]
MYLHGTSRVNEKGHLEIAGCDAVELAQKYGTPLYVYDEQLIRSKIRSFIDAFKRNDIPFQVAYASKALSTVAMCQIASEEGLCLDVVSGGELYTALKAGFPSSRIHFHGNNKTVDEITMALDAQIGCFVVDNLYELHLLNQLATEKGKEVSILLRLSPGVEAHTHEYIQTGQQDSKFGFDIISGQAIDAVGKTMELEYLKLLGFHCHIGSQIFETEGFTLASKRFLQIVEEVKNKYEFEIKVINLGGGFGIRYVDGDNPLPLESYVDAIVQTVKMECIGKNLKIPEIWVEPGRSIVGDAGTTLYTIGSSKNIPGIRKYVAVDGGMSDNVRPALYQARYDAFIANRVNDEPNELVSIAGKCCESGDMLIYDIELPEPKTGEILAVSCTGAYGYSMASNYNRIVRPGVVFVKDGKSAVVVKRETYDQIVQNDNEINYEEFTCPLSG